MLHFRALNIFRLLMISLGSMLFSTSLVCVLEGQEESETTESPTDDTWIVLRVTPKMAEADLNVRLFPDDTMRIKGNAVPVVLRMMWETRSDMWSEIYEKAGEQLELDWSQFDPGNTGVPMHFYSELKTAAWRTDADWEYPYRDPDTNLAGIAIPDAQQSRILFRMLAVNCRADIKRGEIGEAIDKITVGLGLAKHYGVSPFFVIKLVQCVIVDMMLDRVEEIVQQPDAPNLYWAIAGVPPLIDIRTAGEWDRRMVTSAIPELSDLEVKRSPEQWHEIGALLSAQLQSSIGDEKEMQIAIARAGSNVEWMKQYLVRARRELPGVDPSVANDPLRLDTMSDEEVGIRYFMKRYEKGLNAELALWSLPPVEALPQLKKLSEQRGEMLQSAPELAVIVDSYPVCHRVWSVQRRLDALRVVEALRDYAARHGEFPAGLDKITELTLPMDSFTGRPYVYEHNENGTFLSAPDFSPDNRIRYRLELSQ